MIMLTSRLCMRSSFLSKWKGSRRSVHNSCLGVRHSQLLAAFTTSTQHSTIEEVQKDVLLASHGFEWIDEKIQSKIQKIDLLQGKRKICVCDDDPTGTQTVHAVPVLSAWDVATLTRELADPASSTFYLLTNTRALDEAAAVRRAREVAENLAAVARATGREVTVISRGDSTLRGHFPAEVAALAAGMGGAGYDYDAWVLMPFFEEGGRLTAGDVHYVDSGGGRLVPAGQTPFAQDPAFGFRASHLRQWVQEKTRGAVPADQVASVGLDTIRGGGPPAVAALLAGLPKGSVAVANALTQRDLAVVALGCRLAEAAGRRLLYRTAASFVPAYAGMAPRPLLTAEELVDDATAAAAGAAGGLTVVGSYVPKTSEQLLAAEAAVDAWAVELDVAALVEAEGEEGAVDELVGRVTKKVETMLRGGHDVILYTSRRTAHADGAGGLKVGALVNSALCDAVKGLGCRPRYLVAKGGITSNDVAVRSLGVDRAVVRGQLLPGVPVWACGPRSKYPGMNYVVFPGNVGGAGALAEALLKLGARPKGGAGGGGGGARRQYHGAAAGRGAAAAAATRDPRDSATYRILREARRGRYAVGAFNVYNIEGIKAVVAAAEAKNTPAILQVHPAPLAWGGAALVGAARAAAAAAAVPVAVHLDHADREEDIRAALELGVDSVMADGSGRGSFEENCAWTARMAALARARGVPVEAELGKLAGEEDGLSVPAREARMTAPGEVGPFLRATGVQFLAVTIGNVHGAYARAPRLDLERLAACRRAAEAERGVGGVPLVLHGASGLPAGLVRAAVAGGVCKFNVNTEVRAAYMAALRDRLGGGGGGGAATGGAAGGKKLDVIDVMKLTTEAMRPVVEEKMAIFLERQQ